MKKKRGRKKLDIPRNSNTFIRCTADEFDKFTRLAKGAGLSKTDLIIEMLESELVLMTIDPKEKAIQSRMSHDLKNEIMAYANSRGYRLSELFRQLLKNIKE